MPDGLPEADVRKWAEVKQGFQSSGTGHTGRKVEAGVKKNHKDESFSQTKASFLYSRSQEFFKNSPRTN